MARLRLRGRRAPRRPQSGGRRRASGQPRTRPGTRRRFATTQTHWFRIADGKIIEHWANRDDLGTAMQLGWTPPAPLYLIRMLAATHRARRKAQLLEAGAQASMRS